MSTPAKYSTTNVLNTISQLLATNFLADGYLIYWHARDSVQIDETASGWYPSFSQNRAAYAADSTFSTAVANAKGLVTLVSDLPAVPRFVIRLMSDASVGDPDEVPVPAIAIDVGAALSLSAYELGSKVKWRTRHLMLDAYVRSEAEAMQVQDLFAIWFEEECSIPIVDHDAGTQAAVGAVIVLDPGVRALPNIHQGDALTYEVLLNARLVYAV